MLDIKKTFLLFKIECNYIRCGEETDELCSNALCLNENYFFFKASCIVLCSTFLRNQSMWPSPAVPMSYFCFLPQDLGRPSWLRLSLHVLPRRLWPLLTSPPPHFFRFFLKPLPSLSLLSHLIFQALPL